jgi:NAD(P)-dependent dehydrogenase (short-subunit alcohol dehydrogenase family)
MPLLEKKVTVITGASQGIGRAIALAYAQEGARVVLASRNENMLEETRTLIANSGGEALVVPTDVRNEASVQELAHRVREHFGHIDILVANSGIAGPTAPLWEISLQQWEETISTNLTGVFLCCRAFLPQMIQRRTGNIVIIGSGVGKQPFVGRTPYAASKIALVGLTRTLAHDAGPYNVRVNIVSPGLVEGERIERVLRKQAEARGVSYEEMKVLATRETPLRRFVSVEDVAHMTVFLSTEQAASITGTDVNVSAGVVMV